MQQVFLSAQSKSIHAVLVNAIGNVLKDVPDRVYKYGVY